MTVTVDYAKAAHGSNATAVLADGTLSAPALTFAADPDSGIYRIGANNIGISVNGAKVLDVGTTGLAVTGRVELKSANPLRLYNAVDNEFASMLLDAGNIVTLNYPFAVTGALSATGSIGYATGAGGTVAQATNKATGVTLNTLTGEITLDAASLAADTTVSFTLTNSTIAATDMVLITHDSAGTAGAYVVTAQGAAGSANIAVRNVTAGALAEAIVLKFVVFKAVNA